MRGVVVSKMETITVGRWGILGLALNGGRVHEVRFGEPLRMLLRALQPRPERFCVMDDVIRVGQADDEYLGELRRWFTNIISVPQSWPSELSVAVS